MQTPDNDTEATKSLQGNDLPAKKRKVTAADYDATLPAYLSGVPLREIARQQGFVYDNLRAHACKHKWTARATVGAKITALAEVKSDADQGREWRQEVIDIILRVLRTMKAVQIEELAAKGFKPLKELIEAIGMLDTIGRRQFGLDANGGNHSLHLSINADMPLATKRAKVIEVTNSGQNDKGTLHIDSSLPAHTSGHVTTTLSDNSAQPAATDSHQ